ncbi:MAG: ABC transporter permease subunit [Alphaproteobacteria bacterium]|nr:ABC transporter permease subunit [Alphaproteobacteria bacterium]
MLRALMTLIDRELRAQLRDSTVLIYSVLFPMLVIPGVLWFTMQVLLYQESLEEAEGARVALIGEPVELGGLLHAPAEPVEVADALQALRAGKVDLVLEAEAEGDALTLTLHHLSVRPRSARARALIQERVPALTKARRRALAERQGVAPEALGRWAVRAENVDELGNTLRDLLAAGVMPLMLMLLSINAFYPTMELVVGERESGCLETSLIAAPGRGLLLTGKLVAVMALTALPVLGGALSVTLTLASVLVQLTAGDAEGAFSRLAALDLGLGALDLAALAGLLLLCVPLLVGLYALCAIPARSIKEAQTAGTFVMLSIFAPVGYVLTEPALSLTTAAAPLLNATLIGQALLRGEAVAPAHLALTLAVNLGLAALALLAGARLMRSERFLLGDWMPASLLRLQARWRTR